MIKTFSVWLMIFGLSLISACQGAEQQGNLQLKLPKELREISGLSVLQNGSLLAVADEQAQVYQIDMSAGVIAEYLVMGNPAVRGDFEGIATLNNSVYLVTSQGTLWRKAKASPENQHEEIFTDAGEQCEIEGLTAWHEEDSLLLLCKTVYDADAKNTLLVLRWSEKEPDAPTEPLINRSYDELGMKKLHPSGITFSADRQNLFIVAARQKAFVELSLQGQVIRYGKLPKDAGHRQAEGVAITGQNRLYIADEGGKGQGKLTEYARNL